MQAGLESLRGRNDDRLAILENWLESLVVQAAILPMNVACFRCWARLMRGRSRAVMEHATIAATAIVHGLTVETRNTKDFLDFGVPLLDPFVPP